MARSNKVGLWWIEWVDPYSPRDRWYQNNEDLDEAIYPLPVCVSSGWLIRETPDSLTFAQTIFPGAEQVNGVLVLPRGCIKRKKRITVIDV